MKTEIVEALQDIENDGRLTPDHVVFCAADKSSPLHDCFEWDDSVAGHQYRISQARDLIRRVVVIHKVEKTEVKAVAYVRDPSVGNDQGYVAVAKVRTEAETAKKVLAQEFARARAHLKRAESLAQVLGVKEQVTNLVSSVDAVRDRVAAVA